MRIIAGKFKGRTILVPDGHLTRPTAVLTRRMIFDILLHAPWAPSIDNCRVLDAFAGTGSLGFEALSRGALFCSFVDIEKSAFRCIRDTIVSFGIEAMADVNLRSILKFDVKLSNESFDLIFVDPPYHRGLVEKTLEYLSKTNLLSDQSLVVIESARNEQICLNSDWKDLDKRITGTSQVQFVGYSANRS